MSPEFRYHEPLPSKDDHETAALTQERSLGDVVQPRSSLGPRFHLDRLVEFDATAPPGYPRRIEHDDVADRYFHLNDTGTRAAKPARAPTTTTTVPTTRVTTPRGRSATVTTITTAPPTTNAGRASNSSSGTDSSVKSNANGSAENASNDVVSGQLSPDLAVADVPLRGPGTWTVASSAPISVTLTCAGTTITVQTQFEIAAHTSCQITITRSVVHPERHVGTGSEQLGRPLSTRLHGAALALYFALLPYVVLTKWQRTFERVERHLHSSALGGARRVLVRLSLASHAQRVAPAPRTRSEVRWQRLARWSGGGAAGPRRSRSPRHT